MRRIALPGVAVEIPVIGFGCSAITSLGEKNAMQVLGAAFDAGLRHFDVARYYGYGESEKLLGKFLQSRRSQVTITSKFGIQPPRRTNALRLAMQAGRQLVRYVPAVRGFFRSRAQGMVTTGAFGVKEARASLETSLREIGTDYLDFFLLHDYVVSENPPDELLKFLEEAIASGKIRYFGMGTGIENILRALETQPALCSILQFENGVLVRNVEKIPPGGPHGLLITFGALSDSYKAVSEFLKNHSELVRTWSAKLAVDCSREETISALMLNYAACKNPNGLVLFSSRDAARASRNVKAVLEPWISPEQAAAFGKLVEQDVMPVLPAV